MFYKKAVVKTFATFTGKHLCLALFLVKFQTFQACKFVKKRLQHRPSILLKRDCNTGVFLWILQNFQEHLFGKDVWAAAFGTGIWTAIKSRTLTLIFIMLYILKIIYVKMPVKTFLQRKFEKWNISFLLILNYYTGMNFHVSNIWNEIATSMTSYFSTNMFYFLLDIL